MMRWGHFGSPFRLYWLHIQESSLMKCSPNLLNLWKLQSLQRTQSLHVERRGKMLILLLWELVVQFVNKSLVVMAGCQGVWVEFLGSRNSGLVGVTGKGRVGLVREWDTRGRLIARDCGSVCATSRVGAGVAPVGRHVLLRLERYTLGLLSRLDNELC